MSLSITKGIVVLSLARAILMTIATTALVGWFIFVLVSVMMNPQQGGHGHFIGKGGVLFMLLFFMVPLAGMAITYTALHGWAALGLSRRAFSKMQAMVLGVDTVLLLGVGLFLLWDTYVTLRTHAYGDAIVVIAVVMAILNGMMLWSAQRANFLTPPEKK